MIRGCDIPRPYGDCATELNGQTVSKSTAKPSKTRVFSHFGKRYGFVLKWSAKPSEWLEVVTSRDYVVIGQRSNIEQINGKTKMNQNARFRRFVILNGTVCWSALTKKKPDKEINCRQGMYHLQYIEAQGPAKDPSVLSHALWSRREILGSRCRERMHRNFDTSWGE